MRPGDFPPSRSARHHEVQGHAARVKRHEACVLTGMHRLSAVLLILAASTGCEPYAEASYPGTSDPAADGADVPIERAQPPAPPSPPAASARPSPTPDDQVRTAGADFDRASADDGDTTSRKPGRAVAAIRMEISQLESLLRVLRRGSSDRPTVLAQLTADYEELSRAAPTEDEREQAATRAVRVRAMESAGDASK